MGEGSVSREERGRRSGSRRYKRWSGVPLPPRLNTWRRYGRIWTRFEHTAHLVAALKTILCRARKKHFSFVFHAQTPPASGVADDRSQDHNPGMKIRIHGIAPVTTGRKCPRSSSLAVFINCTACTHGKSPAKLASQV